MHILKIRRVVFLVMVLGLLPCMVLKAQDTQILGFVAGEAFYQDDQLNFGFGEQDLFITSQLNDNFSFLGETVFKFSPNSSTNFNASIERVIVGYNYRGNNSVLFGKHHTPVNYWNDSYHHGRVFFPTIARPLLFGADIIPIHTTGIVFQGLNLGKMRFGYSLMIGNGLGASDVSDNDSHKSITTALSIKPWNNWQFRASVYRDVIDAGATVHGNLILNETNQLLYTGSIIYFGPSFELLAEGTIADNDPDGLDRNTSYATYIYTGVPVSEKVIPYLRYDYLDFDANDLFFLGEDTRSIVVGLRYEISYLIVLKMEYQHIDRDLTGTSDKLNAQIAIGF